MTETHAIHLCLKHHDPRGFEWLVRKYRREAFMHARGFMGNEADAADVCQDAFHRAFMAMPRLEQMDKFYPWFYRILRNLCLNRLRDTRKHRDANSGIDPEQVRLLAPETPRTVTETNERREEIHETLDRMQPAFREILILKYFDKMNYDEIAELLGIQKGTVMSRLFYARKAFAKAYKPEQ